MSDISSDDNHLIICPIACSDADVRLVGGNKTTEGTVEVCYYNNWGLISDTEWGSEEAQVVCRQLGFSNPQSNKQNVKYLISVCLY